MDREAELAVVRRAYAKQIIAAAGTNDAALEAAFAAVPREAFLPPGPWPIFRWQMGYVPTPDDDPVHLYINDLVGIRPERAINNGQPSLHAYLLGRAKPRPGEHVVHIGTGAGYYTAIIAELAGPAGKVTGIEYEADLAAEARRNLGPWPQAQVIQGDGGRAAFDPADVIYVNAGATAPAANWLDRLHDGGRLVLPLTTNRSFAADAAPQNITSRGAIFLITRRGDDFDAAWISPVAIFPCAGNRDETEERTLATAFDRGGWEMVTRLHRHTDLPSDQCWLTGKGGCLAYS